MKRLGLPLVGLALLFAPLATAPVHAAQAPVAPALCAAPAAPSTATTLSGAQDVLWKSCFATFCSDESQCWAACPTATSVSCNSGVCQYTQSGGGGGGTGGGTGQCPLQRFCSNNSQCYYSQWGIQGTCSGNTCHC